MPRVSPAITNFTAGEYSPQMFGQIDLAMYPNACRLMRNMICRVHGGAQKRPGTIFVAEVKDNTKETRLIPFQYSTEQAYVLEFGDSYIRVFMDRGQVLNDDSSIYETGTPYSNNDIGLVRFVQDKDIMYLLLSTVPIKKLTRNDHNLWTLINAPISGGPFLTTNSESEIGSNLVINGTMEEDDHWDPVGTPVIVARDKGRVYKGLYSFKIVALEDSGMRSESFTTVTSTNYILRLRVFTDAEKIKIKVHQGSDSGTWAFESTIENIPKGEWTEIERRYTETAGGSGAYIEVLGALAAVTYKSVYPVVYSLEGVKATSYHDTSFYPYIATNPGYTLLGTDTDTSWLSRNSDPQRFHIDLGEKKAISRIYYENGHHTGGDTNRGVQNFTIWGTNSVDSFNELEYAVDTGWTQLTAAETHFERHSATNVADPQYILLTAGGLYQYYAFKFADNYGGTYFNIRRIELQTYDAVDINVDEVEIMEVVTLLLTPSAKTGNITITASKDMFVAGHIDSLFRITHGEVSGIVKITGVTSGTVAAATVEIDLGSTDATGLWQEGAWSDKNGYPSCGAFYEQRLIVGSSKNDEDAVWGSKPTEYENFTPGVLDDDPIGYKLQSDIIRWLAPMGQLVVGTVNSEYRLGAQNSSDAVTPTNVKLTQQSRKGSSDLEPVNVGNAILFVQRRGNAGNYGTKLRELSYNYVNDSYDGIDLTLFAEHITGAGLKRIAFMSSPYPIVWGATADGKLIGMTYEREQKVIGWHYHPMDGLVEDICVIPGENQDDLYMIVNRTIGGVTKRFIEVMSDFDYGTDLDDAYFVDCGLTYDGTPVSSVSGLDHLEGEMVAVLADGIVQTQKVVTSGALTLDTAASVVHVGLPYTSELEPLDLQGGSIEGTSQGKIKRIHGVALYLYNSMGGEIGQDEDTTERIFYKEETEGEGEQLDLFTGIKDDFNFSGDWQLEGRVYIKHDDPLPFTVLSILPRFRTEDR